MNLGKVIGNVVATTAVSDYGSKKILIIQPIDPRGNAKGKTFLAVDAVQAGVGDTVITIEEGNSARAAINEPESFTIKAVVAGIVDQINFQE